MMVKLRKDASPWVKRAIEILEADEGWHDYEELMAQLVILVPPGMAVRRIQNERANRPRVHPISTEDSIRYGSRDEVRISLRGLRESGRLEYEYDNESTRSRIKRIRLNPNRRRGPWTRQRANPWTTTRGTVNESE